MATSIPTLPALVAGQRAQVAAEQVLRDALRKPHDPDSDLGWRESLQLVRRDVAVSTDATYPGWIPGMAHAPACQDRVDAETSEHHTVDGTRYLCHTDDHYCPPRDTTGGQP
jgi:hypothetical protein